MISPKSYPESYPVRYQRFLNAARVAFASLAADVVALLSGGVWSMR